jgi:photosystem II stability/assembly factor-like uncharacterized protein
MHMRRWSFILASAAFSVTIALAILHFAVGTTAPSAPFTQEIARLERLRAHARSGSAEAFKFQRKIDRIRAYVAGKPQLDNPGEFARILAEMRIPDDRTVSEYVPGYQNRELQQALRARGKSTTDTALPWVSRGPGNVAGRARGIVVDPDDATNQTWFIATVGGGVWKTTDGGATWTWLTPGFPVLSTSTIAMASSNHDVLYVGTGESFYNVDAINGNGILKSTDRGVTWTHLASTVDNAAFNNVARIIVDPSNPNLVLAAATNGRYKEFLGPRSSIYKSIDGGITWTEKYASTTIGANGYVKKVLQLVADPTDFNILYATVDEAGVLKSTNRGETWTLINTGITNLSGRFELAISPVDHNRLYASAEGASHSELWVTTNGGTGWLHTVGSTGEPNWLGAQGWYDNTIVCHPTNVNIVYVGGVYLARLTMTSTTSRTYAWLNGPHVDHHGLAIINAPGGWRILDTNDGGVAVSTSTDTGFNQVIDGMVTTQFYGIDKRPGASAYVGGMQDNSTWLSPIDPASTTPWTFCIGGDGYETSWNFDDPTKLIGGYQYNGLQRSTDGGATWSSAITSVSPAGTIDNGSGNAPFITKIAKSQINPERLCAAGVQGVWRSNDFGATWSLAAIPSATWGAISSFHCVKISRADPNVVWGGARMGGTGMIHRSADGGATFSTVPNYTTVTMGGISGLATHPTDANTAYVLFGFAGRPKILRTTDAGANWQDITGFTGGSPSTSGFPDIAVYDLLVFSNNTNRLWAATEVGIVESLDGGATWAIADNGLPHVAIWFLAEVEDEIVVATHGRGVWSVTMPDLVAGKTFKPLIEQLYQAPSGFLKADFNLRSEYDSTRVLVDGVVFTTFPANAARQGQTVEIPVATAGTKQVVLHAFKGGAVYPSVTKSLDVFASRTPVYVYQNDFETSTDDFYGSLFRIGSETGFTGSAIHSLHPYGDSSSPTYMLTVPIRVASLNADLAFDELALVEPGEAGSVFGDANFYDYVVVEGSRDGAAWIPLAPGYDCRAYPEWETAYNANSPSPSLLRRRSINLLGTFAADETVLIRFRLYADGAANGWGWMIDNLEIQPAAISSAPERALPAALALDQNMPNPVRSQTVIGYALPRSGPVTLSIFDVSGRLTRTLVSGVQDAGTHAVVWDGRDQRGVQAANGTYFYHLAATDRVLQRKMMLVR